MRYITMTQEEYDQMQRKVDAQLGMTERLLDQVVKDCDRLSNAIRQALDNLGVPHADYPAPIVEAYNVLHDALEGKFHDKSTEVQSEVDGQPYSGA